MGPTWLKKKTAEKTKENLTREIHYFLSGILYVCD